MHIEMVAFSFIIIFTTAIATLFLEWICTIGQMFESWPAKILGTHNNIQKNYFFFLSGFSDL